LVLLRPKACRESSSQAINSSSTATNNL
jgi:hypothetical protein